MLRQRLLATAVLLPAAIAWALFAPLELFAGLGAVVVLLGAWEWIRLVGYAAILVRLSYLAVALVLVALLGTALVLDRFQALLLWIFVLFWLILALQLFSSFRPSRPLLAGEGLVMLLATWWVVVFLRQAPGGGGWVIALLAVVSAADTGAYFTGRAWGRHRLAPTISPGKTWEGFVGGMAGGILVGCIAGFWVGISPWMLALVALATAIFSVIGDLTESRLKRWAGVKNSGRLIPGHGGLLDRIDGLMAAAPVFALGFELVRNTR